MLLFLEATSALQPLSLSSRSLCYKGFLFCLLLRLHFSLLHAEPWLKTLRMEAQEVGGEKRADPGFFSLDQWSKRTG